MLLPGSRTASVSRIVLGPGQIILLSLQHSLGTLLLSWWWWGCGVLGRWWSLLTGGASLDSDGPDQSEVGVNHYQPIRSEHCYFQPIRSEHYVLFSTNTKHVLFMSTNQKLVVDCVDQSEASIRIDQWEGGIYLARALGLGESTGAPFFSSERGTAPFLTGVSGGRSLSNNSGEM